MLDRCLKEVTENQRLPSMGSGWTRLRDWDHEDDRVRLRHYRHRDSGLVALFTQSMPDRRVIACGNGVHRFVAGSRLVAATEAWAEVETAAGRLVDTGREDGLGRNLEPVPGQIRSYLWCGLRGAASVRLDLSEFPPARMEIAAAPRCDQRG